MEKIMIKVVGMFSNCYIPKYDMYFATKTEHGNDAIIKKANAMITVSNNFKNINEDYKRQLENEDEKNNETKAILDGYKVM